MLATPFLEDAYNMVMHIQGPASFEEDDWV